MMKYSEYVAQGFNWYEMELIKDGLEKHLDVSLYADKSFNTQQMQEIYQGLLDGVDASLYANPDIGFMQMLEIRKGLNNKINLLNYCTPYWDYRALQEVRLACEKHLSDEQIKVIANAKFNFKQMREIRRGFEQGIDASKYARPELTYQEMQSIRMEK